MKLDVAPAAIRSRGSQFTRREDVPIAEGQSESVVPTGFAVVLQPHAEPDGKVARAAVDLAFSADITCLGKRRVHEVTGDPRAFQVSGRVEAVMDDVYMAPERAILAATVGAEVDLRAVVVDDQPPPVMKSQGAGTKWA